MAKKNAQKRKSNDGTSLASRWEKVSISSYVALTATIASLIAVVSFSYIAINETWQGKRQDILSIFYLEQQILASRLSGALAAEISGSPGGSKKDSLEIKFLPKGKLSVVRGKHEIATLSDLKIGSDYRFRTVDLLMIDGVTYLTHLNPQDLRGTIPAKRLHKVDAVLFGRRIYLPAYLRMPKQLLRETRIYVVNHQGHLLYSSHKEIKVDNYLRRPIVQRFIDVPLAKAQSSWTTDDGKTTIGFFSEVPLTNAVLFVEVSEDVIRSKTYEILKKLLVTGATIILMVFLLIFLAMTKIRSQFGNVLRAMHEYSKGNFRFPLHIGGSGELVTLSKAFRVMGEQLLRRQKAIKSLMAQQEEKIRLEQDLTVAKQVQSTLLVSEPAGRHKSIHYASWYLPASYVAGDWYGSAVCDHGRQLTLAIADVSGHGVGAAMFTAVTAATFSRLVDPHKAFGLEDFLGYVNESFLALGQGRWHATLQVLSINLDNFETIIYNAGHLPPLLIEAATKRSSVLTLRSEPVGMQAGASWATTTLTLNKGDVLLVHTDGLTEAKNRKARHYGRKRLANTLLQHSEKNVAQIVEKVTQDYEKFTGIRFQQEDDICLLCIKRMD